MGLFPVLPGLFYKAEGGVPVGLQKIQHTAVGNGAVLDDFGETALKFTFG